MPPPTVGAQQLVQDLAFEAGRVAASIIRPTIPSSILRRALRVERREYGAALHIPHYFAWLLHDGRDAIVLGRGQQMIFFPNPADDPRGTIHERESGRPRLTHQQFLAFAAENRRRAVFGIGPIMIVTKRVKGAPGRPFFEEASGVADATASIFSRGFRDWFLPQIESETSVAEARL